MIPSMSNNNTSMPFSVTDILQPMDSDASNSYKRSLEMAHALATSTSSSSSTNGYPLARPSTSISPTSLSHSSFAPSSVSNNYYNPTVSSTSAFSPNHQYYDYSATLPSAAGTAPGISGQYSPSSCWYGPAASELCRRRVPVDVRSFSSVKIFGQFLIRGRQCRTGSERLRPSSRSDDEIGLQSISIRVAETETTNSFQPRTNLRIGTTIQTAEVSQRTGTRESRQYPSIDPDTSTSVVR